MSKHNLKMLIKFQSLWTTLLITVTEYNSNPWCSPCHILLNNNSVPLGRVTSACSSQPFREEKKSLNIGSVARNLCETSSVSWEIVSSSFCLVSRFLSLGTPSVVASLWSAGSGEEAGRAEGWRRAFGSSLSRILWLPFQCHLACLGITSHRVWQEKPRLWLLHPFLWPHSHARPHWLAHQLLSSQVMYCVYICFSSGPLTLIMMYNIPQTFTLW